MPIQGTALLGKGVKGVGGLLYAGGGVIERWRKLPITSTPTGAEQDTGWDLPANALVTDVLVQVTTAEVTGTTKTLSVGLLSTEAGGDTDGFLSGIDVSSTGLKAGTFTFTDGVNQNYVSSATLGVLLYDGILGADAAGQAGTVAPVGHLTSSVTAKSVVYQAGSANWAEFRGAIYVRYYEFV